MGSRRWTGFLGVLFLGFVFHGTTMGLVPDQVVKKHRIDGSWAGTIQGNDRAVTAVLTLRQDGDVLKGTLRWSSAVSGTSLREVAGSYDADGGRLRLRDLRFLQSDPNPLWMFCLVDEYQLVLDPASGALSGSYRSSECNDQAAVVLHRE